MVLGRPKARDTLLSENPGVARGYGKPKIERRISSYRRRQKEHLNNELIETLRKWVNEEAEFRISASETLRGLGGRNSTRRTRRFTVPIVIRSPRDARRTLKTVSLVQNFTQCGYAISSWR